MMFETLILSIAIASAAAAPAPQPAPSPPPMMAPPPPPPPLPVPPKADEPDTRPYVALVTDAGTIVVRIENKRAPVTAANFLRYVDTKRMDGFSFYRTTRSWGPDSKLVQAGNRGDARKNFPLAGFVGQWQGMRALISRNAVAQHHALQKQREHVLVYGIDPFADFV